MPKITESFSYVTLLFVASHLSTISDTAVVLVIQRPPLYMKRRMKHLENNIKGMII